MWGSSQVGVMRDLNSRSPVGSDVIAQKIRSMKQALFKLTLPCGERHTTKGKTPEQIQFKLTLPCGERRGIQRRLYPTGNLNSRSPVGSDDDADQFLFFLLI